MNSSLLCGVAGADLLEVLALCDRGRNIMTIRYSPCRGEEGRSDGGADSTQADAGRRTTPDFLGESSDPFACAQVGQLLGVDPSGNAQVRLEGSRSRMVARNVCSLGHVELQQAARIRRRVVIVFENGDPSRPMVVGVLTGPGNEPSGGADTGEFLVSDLSRQGNQGARVGVDSTEARVGAGDETILIECGHASISVRRSGRVVIQGTSRSDVSIPEPAAS